MHDAFSDPDVKLVLPVEGGSTSDELLKYIDYDLIKKNPKVFCGLSDITFLVNAIYTKTELVTYYGPHFTRFGADKFADYRLEYFRKCLFEDAPILLHPSQFFGNSEWDTNEIKNHGYWLINQGEAEGKTVGGNLLSLNYLQGSEFMPDIAGAVLFLEDNHLESTEGVQNQLQAISNQPNFNEVRGIVLGRFQKETKISEELLTKIIKKNKAL